jgi:serine protease inhibitor
VRVDPGQHEAGADRARHGVAFTPAADFTGLSPQACCIGLVEHAATLDVGEKGTVTSRATGEPLFMARVAGPSRD